MANQPAPVTSNKHIFHYSRNDSCVIQVAELKPRDKEPRCSVLRRSSEGLIAENGMLRLTLQEAGEVISGLSKFRSECLGLTERIVLDGSVFGVRITNVLNRLGITSLEQLSCCSIFDLMGSRGFGEVCLKKVNRVLSQNGYAKIEYASKTS